MGYLGLDRSVQNSNTEGATTMVEMVQIIRIAPGRYDDFLKRRATLKSLRESAGASQARYMRILTGANAGAVAVILTFPDWRKFGEATQKLRENPEWRKLMETTRRDSEPFATIVDSILTESLED
jgi:hypothetical protein